MKFASSVIALALASGVVVNGMSIRGNTKHANKLIASARRLEEGSGDEQGSGDSGDEQESGDAADEISLVDYSITLLSCTQGEIVMNEQDAEEGEEEEDEEAEEEEEAEEVESEEGDYVVFRLCPSSSCNMTTSILGCDDSYGDYVVDIDTFLQVYMESLGEEEQQSQDAEEEEGEYTWQYQEYDNPMVKYNEWNQAFDGSQYMECTAYEAPQGGNNYYRDMQFYIAPTCTADGKSIALQTYMDEDCSTVFEGNFSQINSGWESLPFSDGGLVSMECVSCMTVDENYNVDVNEMCGQEFESIVAQCDNTTASGCETVESLLYKAYGNLTEISSISDRFAGVKDAASQAANQVKDAAKEASTKFMDTMSTQEARAFIAAMVVFGLSFFAGLSFITCICVKKRRQKQATNKAAQGLLDGSDDEDESVQKRRSSVVSLVRTGTNQLKAAFEKKEEDEDKTVKSDYYEAPEAAEAEEPKTPKRTSKFFAKIDKHVLKKKLSVVSPKNLSLKFPLSPKSKK